MLEVDRFRFIPFAEQTKPKVHTIRLGIDFSQYPFPSYNEKPSPCCKHPLTTVYEEFKVPWGNDYGRLECVIENTPQVRCDCGRTWLPPQVAIPIQGRAAAIRRFFEFRKPEDLGVISTFLADEDVTKVRDFADALRKGNAVTTL